MLKLVRRVKEEPRNDRMMLIINGLMVLATCEGVAIWRHAKGAGLPD